MNTHTCKKTPIVIINLFPFSSQVLGTSITVPYFHAEVVHALELRSCAKSITMFLLRKPNVSKEQVQIYRKIKLLQQTREIK